jgi:NADPH:quinone reductase-like Zn-dependent oxidoreductase
MALLTGGGYASEVVTDARTLLRAPAAFSNAEAGGFMETFATAFSNLFMLGEARAGDTVLVHGGGSGVGTAALMLCREAGVRALVTASAQKRDRCLALGAAAAIDYHSEDFVEAVKHYTKGEGVRLVLDCIGGSYLEKNLRALAVEGRLLIIGLMGGARAELPLTSLLSRRLQILGSTLRSRTVTAKAEILGTLEQRFGAAMSAGRLRPVIDRVLPLEQAAEAHRRMQSSAHFGKIVLDIDGEAQP